ncbi:MAG: hydroxymethylglutaryl-CoA reductase [Flavobacteriaceae bacterium]|nr:hydroxymethylglutaryl-CoA reductase [Flavobacteriaceae bacterium]
MNKLIHGFSKLSSEEKIDLVTNRFFENPLKSKQVIDLYRLANKTKQQVHERFSENTISNFLLPFSVAPNFLINQKTYCLPMVTEESSVVAAAANAAKFWYSRGGFQTRVDKMVKKGQVHFFFSGDNKKLEHLFDTHKSHLIKSTKHITHNMDKRGGGIQSIKFINSTDLLSDYYQLDLEFITIDAMGANFINSCLEVIAQEWNSIYNNSDLFSTSDYFEVLMSILSNHNPDCRVYVKVECPVNSLGQNTTEAHNYARRFVLACKIASVSLSRAVTHNKGILNGIDAVLIATGNDFRAVEASIHSYASINGAYQSLSQASISKGIFRFEMTIPLSIGTIGGLTKLHPLVNWGHQLLQWPNAERLMEIIAAAGLAQNFSAINSLITSGIQSGHMKMHLQNILSHLKATDEQRLKATKYFKNRKISVKMVEDYLNHKTSP